MRLWERKHEPGFVRSQVTSSFCHLSHKNDEQERSVLLLTLLVYHFLRRWLPLQLNGIEMQTLQQIHHHIVGDLLRFAHSLCSQLTVQFETFELSSSFSG